MALQSFFNTYIPAFGVDISERSIKVAAVTPTISSPPALMALGEAYLEEGIIVGGRIQDAEKVAAGIRAALEGVKGKHVATRHVVCALPEEQSFVRVIQLPKLSFEEIAKAVQWEVEANIPVPIEQVYFDWHVLQEVTKQNGDHLDLLIAAVPKEIVDGYVQALEAAHLIPLALEIESFSLGRSILRFGFSYPPVLVIDFGERRVGLAIFSGESIRLTSTIPSGGASLTDAIATAQKLSLEDAETQKRAHGIRTDTPEGKKNRESSFAVLKNLTAEVNEYIEFYRTHAMHEHSVYTLSVAKAQQDRKFDFRPVAGGETLVAREAQNLGITKIILSGGESALPGMLEYFTEAFRIPVEHANSFVNLSATPASLKIEPRDALRYPTAIGLALHSFVDNAHRKP